MPSTLDLVRELDRAQVPYDLIPHERTMTALAEARAVGADPHEVAKTIVPIPKSLKKNGCIRVTFWIDVSGASNAFIPTSPDFWRTRLSVTAKYVFLQVR